MYNFAEVEAVHAGACNIMGKVTWQRRLRCEWTSKTLSLFHPNCYLGYWLKNFFTKRRLRTLYPAKLQCAANLLSFGIQNTIYRNQKSSAQGDGVFTVGGSSGRSAQSSAHPNRNSLKRSMLGELMAMKSDGDRTGNSSCSRQKRVPSRWLLLLFSIRSGSTGETES